MITRMSKKHVFHYYHYTECDSFEEYLHNMSLNGWHFCSWKAGLVFEKGEPEDITYAVEVFPKSTEMDTHPENDAVEYADYCRAAGWKLIDGKRKFCIFRKEKPDAVSIVTEEERFRNVSKAEKRALVSQILVPFLILLMWWLQAWLNHFSQWRSAPGFKFLYIVFTVLVAFRFLECLEFFRWQRCSAKALKKGKKIRYRRSAFWNVMYYLMLTILIVSLLFYMFSNNMGIMIIPVMGMFISLLLLLAGIEIVRPSRTGNWAAQIIGSILIIYIFIIVFTLVLFIQN